MKTKASVIISSCDPKTGTQLNINECSGVYFVTYNNKPINISLDNKFTEITKHYPRTCYSNPGYAKALARKLNKHFNTDLFQVQVTTESKLYE